MCGIQTLHEDQAAALAQWAVEDGAKKILVVHNDPAAFVNVAKQVAPVAKGASVDLLSVKFSPEMKEYRDAMAKYAPDAPVDFSTLTGFAYAKAFAEIAKTIDGDITSDSITKAFQNAKDVETGIMPTLSFDEQQHLGATDLQRVTAKDGKWTAVGDFFTPRPRD